MKYKKEIIEDVIKNISSGLNIQDSCQLAGIHKDTYYQWLKKKPDFADAIKNAELKCKKRALILIQKAGETDWRALGWFLERKFQNEFAIKQKVEHSGDIQFSMKQFMQVIYDKRNGTTTDTLKRGNRLAEEIAE